MYAKKSVSMKVVVLLLAVVLLIGCTVGGTLAWLMDTSNAVTNTFSAGNIDISLAETANNGFKILPGKEEEKDPVVTVEGGSEACWVFVQVQEKNNVAATDNNNVTTHKYVTWEIDGGVWTKLNEDNGVITYYATASYTTQDNDKTYNVLSNAKVSYSDALTKDMIDQLYNEDGTINTSKQPELNFKAFAVQKEAGDTAAMAWETVPTSEYLGYVAP